MHALTYSDAIQGLENRQIMPDRPPALDKTTAGLERIGLNAEKIQEILNGDLKRVIIVAGTNGKGSVAATLEALFSAAGERVGLYTSPHLVDYTERVRVGGQDISKEQFIQAYKEVVKRTDDLDLSHFEVLTLMASWIFFSGKMGPVVDRAILEVGLGGLWDSTNAIPHGVAVIAALGKDHEHLLGHTLNEIAVNKFGVISKGSFVFHSPLPDEVKELALDTMIRTRSEWVESVSFKYQAKQEARGASFSMRTPWGKTPSLALPGFRGAQNSALALTVFKGMGYSPEKFLHVLENVRWPGRMQRIESSLGPAPVYVSADHNPQGIESLLELLPYYPRKHLHILAAVVNDKDLDGIMAPLFAMPETSIYLTETSFRRRKIEDYGVWGSKARGAWSDAREAFREIAARAPAEDLILVTGSAYLVGQCLTLTPR